MVYAYLRVSTDKQELENQQMAIENFATQNNLFVKKWVMETVSGVKSEKDRQLGKLLQKIKKGDLLLCTEISRIGRTTWGVMSIINDILKKDARVWTINDNHRFDDDVLSYTKAFLHTVQGKMERDLISQRTRQGLARKKAEGHKLGRPHGYLMPDNSLKLAGKEHEIKIMLENNVRVYTIAKTFKTTPKTVNKFIKRHDLKVAI